MRSCTIVLAALMCMGIFGCSESSGPAVVAIPTPGDPRALDEGVPCGDPLEVPLRLQNGRDVGTLLVYNDEVNLTVEFDVSEPWLMAETQVVFSDPPARPHRRWARFQCPRRQRQPLGDRHEPPVSHYTYWVNLEEAGWSVGDTLCLNGRAEVAKSGEVGPRLRPRTAWAGGPGCPASVRGRTLMYVIQPCEEGGGEGEDGGGSD
jgi:hypothetical protein